MYLQPEQALGLIGECAERFPGGRLLFDLPPLLVIAGPDGYPDIAALQGADNAVQPVRCAGRRPGRTRCRVFAPFTTSRASGPRSAIRHGAVGDYRFPCSARCVRP